MSFLHFFSRIEIYFFATSPQDNRIKGKRKKYFKKLLLNSQKRPGSGSGSGSASSKNAASRSTLNQSGSETLEVTHTPKYDCVTVSVHELTMLCPPFCVPSAIHVLQGLPNHTIFMLI